jgi:hypothetical protein
MRCGHVTENPAHVPRRPCGQETERRCSHCNAPRCTDHGIKIGAEFLCVTGARERALDRYAPTIDPPWR